MKTKVRSKLFLLLTVTGLSSFSSAQNDRVPTLQIFTGENSKPSYEYKLDDTRKIFLGADDFTIQFYNVSNQTFKFGDVRCIRFDTGDPSSIESAQLDREGGSLSFNGRALVVRGCEQPSELRVFDLTGRKVLGIRVQEDAEVSTGQLEAGIYIATVNNHSIKFIQQ